MKIFIKSKLKKKREFFKDENGGYFAIYSILLALKTKDALQDVKREIALMKKMKHPNII